MARTNWKKRRIELIIRRGRGVDVFEVVECGLAWNLAKAIAAADSGWGCLPQTRAGVLV